MESEKKAIQTTYLSIFGNAFLAIAKGVTGYFGNSYALIADAIESTCDIFSSILVLFGIKYSSRPADKNHPYGHGKAEPLITFLVVGFLVISAVIIAFESIRNIQTPHELPAPYTLVVLGCIIIIKEIFYRIVIKKSEETGSSSLKADAWHHRSDAITSLTAFAGISLALILGNGYETLDDWAALVASAFILYNSFRIFRPALAEIMDEHVYDELIKKIRDSSLEVEGVLNTEKCYIRKTGMKYHVDLHLIVKGDISVKEGHMIAHHLKDHIQLKLPQIADVLIHVEPDE
ncbi:MAG: cation diffusion facilitator family transporter [Bacteroidota bacterium]|nr:cation diffusion facilitator family transporter [Bacteroidota bacterium]